MDISKQNFLFFTRTMGLGGTENVILQLCEFMNGSVNKLVVCSNGGINVEKLNKLGIKHYEIPDIEDKAPQNIIKIFFRILSIIKKEKISVIHTHHRMAAFYATILHKIIKFVFISTSHNIFKDKKILTHYIYKDAKVIAVGSKVKENLCSFYKLLENNVTIINNTVEKFDEKIVPVDELNKYKKSGYFLVGNIGRLTKQKGMKYFIRSIPYVLNKFEKVKFFIVGEGEEEYELKSLARELNVSESVIFLGYREDIQNIMSQLDLVVISSLWEGFPLVPIEAFSVGKTIIATNIDGTNEIVVDKHNGILVNSKSEKEISREIINLINDNKLLKELEKNALNTYYKEFSYYMLKKKYIDYYSSLEGK